MVVHTSQSVTDVGIFRMAWYWQSGIDIGTSKIVALIAEINGNNELKIISLSQYEKLKAQGEQMDILRKENLEIFEVLEEALSENLKMKVKNLKKIFINFHKKSSILVHPNN